MSFRRFMSDMVCHLWPYRNWSKSKFHCILPHWPWRGLRRSWIPCWWPCDLSTTWTKRLLCHPLPLLGEKYLRWWQVGIGISLSRQLGDLWGLLMVKDGWLDGWSDAKLGKINAGMARVIPPTSRQRGSASGAHWSLGKREQFGAIMKCGSWWQLMAYGKGKACANFRQPHRRQNNNYWFCLGKRVNFASCKGGFSKSNSDAQLSCWALNDPPSWVHPSCI